MGGKRGGQSAGAFAFALTCALAPTVRGTEPKPAVNGLHYEVKTRCPSEAEFVELVRERGEELQLAESAISSLYVTFEEGRDGARGVIRATNREGVVTERVVRGQDCSEAADGLALVLAFVLHEERERAAKNAPVPLLKPESASAAPPPSETPSENEDQSDDANEESAATFEARALAFVENGVAPMPLPGAFGTLGLGFARQGFFAPSFRLGALVSTAESVEAAGGSATFQWLSGRAELCGALADISSRFRFRVCPLFEAGAIVAKGAGLDVTETVTVPWLAPGLGASFEYGLWGEVSLELNGTFVFPLTHDRFLLESEVIHELPTLALEGSLGLRFGP